MVAVARLNVVSLARPASRYGTGGLRLVPCVLEMQPAPTTRMPAFPTSDLTSHYLSQHSR